MTNKLSNLIYFNCFYSDANDVDLNDSIELAVKFEIRKSLPKATYYFRTHHLCFLASIEIRYLCTITGVGSGGNLQLIIKIITEPVINELKIKIGFPN